jgi:hypothetical protein
MRWLLGIAVVGALFTSCADHDPEMDRIGGPLPDGGDTSGGSAGSSGGSAGSAGSAGAAGADANPCPPIDPNLVNPSFPCEIDAILEAKCRRCHTEPQQNGAPFPLLTWQDTQEEYFLTPIYKRMHNAVKTDFMPFVALPLEPPVEPLTPAEKAKLLEWLECALPVEAQTCP